MREDEETPEVVVEKGWVGKSLAENVVEIRASLLF